MISLLVAMDRNRVIGSNNDLPWRLPKDLRFFKEKTTGNTIIMGSRTFDSMGGALPNRRNIVISRSGREFPENVEVLSSISQLEEINTRHPEDELFVIGGGNIFEQTLELADRMYITFIDEAFEGDTYFPEFNAEDWLLTSKVKGERNATNPYDYYFLQYDRA